jgi:hypothetical protein
MLTALVRGATVIASGLLLGVACSGRTADESTPDASVIVPNQDPALSPDQAPAAPPERDAGPPLAPEPPPCAPDRTARQFCSYSPACEYEHIAEDSYANEFLDPYRRCPQPPEVEPEDARDAGASADADAEVDPACRFRTVEEFTCTCTNSSTGEAYTLVYFNGFYTTMSLYFERGDAGPGELIAAVQTTDVCDQCGCVTTFGEVPDCACPYDPEFGAY